MSRWSDDDPPLNRGHKRQRRRDGQKEVYEDSSFPNLPSKSLIICFLIKFHHPRSIHSVWKSHKKSNFSKSWNFRSSIIQNCIRYLAPKFTHSLDHQRFKFWQLRHLIRIFKHSVVQVVWLRSPNMGCITTEVEESSQVSLLLLASHPMLAYVADMRPKSYEEASWCDIV